MAQRRKRKEFKGTIRIQARGCGFITPDPDSGFTEDIYVAPRDTCGALSGDRVIAVYIPAEGYRDRLKTKKMYEEVTKHGSAVVISVCTRASHVYSGTVYSDRQDHVLCVRANALRYSGRLRLEGELSGLSAGDIITFDLIRMPEVSPFNREILDGAAIPLQTVGKEGDIGADVSAIAAAKGLPVAFPDAVMEECKAIGEEISEEEINAELAKGRRDLRDLRIVTIDSAETKDVDDGVSLEINERGNYVLGVHIADVTHYVKEGSALDKEARMRGTSVYLVDRVIPMLPRKLSNGICSLNKGENRFALTVMMEIGHDGKVLSHEIFESLIRVEYKITYEQLYLLLENQDDGIQAEYAKYKKDLAQMRILAGILGRMRTQGGSVDFFFPETHVQLDEKGVPTEISEYKLTYANNIIEEFMLICNQTVAKTFSEQDVPFLYRVHEAPRYEKTEELSRIVQNLGFRLCRNRDGEVEPRDYQDLMKDAEGHPFEAVISLLALRSMQKAVYSEENKGHFGLAFDDYTHFTSPIRRYPDLFIHRMIKLVLSGTLDKETKERLFAEVTQLADSCSGTERNAEEAERESIDLKVTEYMSRFVGESFTGIVSSVTSFGLFVRLENGAEGLLRYESFTNDYYEFDPDRLMARSSRTGKKIRIGDPYKVIVAACDIAMRKIEFVPAEAGRPAQKENGSRGNAKYGRSTAGKGKASSGTKRRSGSGKGRSGRPKGPRTKGKNSGRRR